MNILAEITKHHLKKNIPDLAIGDTIKVHQKIRDTDAKGKDRERVQIFEGIVIARKHGSGIEGTFTVRKIAVGGIGVERVFPLHSPNIVKIERTKSAKVRQSKLYFLRDVQSSSMRLRKESRSPKTWEETGAEEEIEAMKEEAAEAAAENAAEEDITTETAEIKTAKTTENKNAESAAEKGTESAESAETAKKSPEKTE